MNTDKDGIQALDSGNLLNILKTLYRLDHRGGHGREVLSVLRLDEVGDLELELGTECERALSLDSQPLRLQTRLTKGRCLLYLTMS